MEPSGAFFLCPHCGERFEGDGGGAVPTHDFPKPCRSVCPGSGKTPRLPGCVNPLWKDESPHVTNLRILRRWCVGELADETGSEAAKHGWSMRIVEQDGARMIGTCDVNMMRFNVRVKDGRISEVVSIG